jgi:parallel beta-helix repeat protein
MLENRVAPDNLLAGPLPAAPAAVAVALGRYHAAAVETYARAEGRSGRVAAARPAHLDAVVTPSGTLGQGSGFGDLRAAAPEGLAPGMPVPGGAAPRGLLGPRGPAVGPTRPGPVVSRLAGGARVPMATAQVVPPGNQPHPGAGLVVAAVGGPPDGNPAPVPFPAAAAAKVYTVKNTDDNGLGSLRDAIDQVNKGKYNTIKFNIPPDPITPGVWTIRTATALPPIKKPVVIDGTTQPGYDPNKGPVIEISGPGPKAKEKFDGLTINATNVTVRGLTVILFRGEGIYLSNLSGNDLIEGCDIGTDNTNATGLGNTNVGVLINCSGNTIGGTAPGMGNLISGNRVDGIQIIGSKKDRITADSNLVQNDVIGLDSTGAPLPNGGSGVYIVEASKNIIGVGMRVGALVGAADTISGNKGNGVRIEGADATGNQVGGDFIGTNTGGTEDTSGGQRLGNVLGGVLIQDAPGNFIGGSDTKQMNVISGNIGNGAEIIGAEATGNKVLNNLIGLRKDGDEALPNTGDGVAIVGAPKNEIGGSNVISGNKKNGVRIEGAGATKNQVDGSYIGTNKDGDNEVPNAQDGVLISDAPENLIGGPVAVIGGVPQMGKLPGNVISGNSGAGVEISGQTAKNNNVQGNLIGVSKDDNQGLGNSYGVLVTTDATTNFIGGSAPGLGNVISKNTARGVEIEDLGGAHAPSSVTVRGNFIGTDIAGTLELGNGGDGILIDVGKGFAASNMIGGPGQGDGNTIAFNQGAGVYVDSGDGNTIRRNSIFGNVEKGIILNKTDEANRNQATATISNAVFNFKTKETVVAGEIDSTNRTPFSVEVFENTANDKARPQGKTYLPAKVEVNPKKGQPNVYTVVATIDGNLKGHFITVTVTDAAGDTSGFSTPVEVK